ncbi:hypothetical protein [Kitasatospora herbaricolor]|uniref:hypothetical protein n=1 Tax=Kitasatospora herbaricolor TaxID=68217 RepID=UPI0039A59F19
MTGLVLALQEAEGAGVGAPALIRAARESFVDGWRHAMWAGVAVMAVLLLHLLARGVRHSTRTSADASEPAGAGAP